MSNAQSSHVGKSPKNIVTMVVSAVPVAQPPRGCQRDPEFTAGEWSISHSRRSRRGVVATELRSGHSLDAAWSALQQCFPESGSTWVLVPSVSEWLILTDGYAKMADQKLWFPGSATRKVEGEAPDADSPSHRPGWMALGGSTEALSGRLSCHPVEIVGVGNYWPGSVPELLASLVTREVVADAIHTDRGRYREHHARTCSSLHRWFCNRIAAWSALNVGTWRHSASQLAHTAGRSIYGRYVVTPTDRPEVRIQERDACYGGRAEVFNLSLFNAAPKLLPCVPKMASHGCRVFTTEILARVDIRSFYPWILSAHLAPRQLHSVLYEKECKSQICQDVNAVQLAYCKIHTAEPLYPCRVKLNRVPVHCGHFRWPMPTAARHQVRTIFPIGDFWTTLCGPELQLAARRGDITEAWNLSTYSVTDKIQPFAKYLMEGRQRAESQGDFEQAATYKMMANSYLGKFAAMRARWEMDKTVGAPFAFGEWIMHDDDENQVVKYRSVGWNVQRQRDKEDSASSHPIMWAWATSIGRVLLKRLMDVAGEAEVIQCDTDGFYCTAQGIRSLTAAGLLPATPAPGQLRVVSWHQAGRFWGPKHYWVEGGGWTMSGVPDGFTIGTDGPEFAYRTSYRTPQVADYAESRGRVTKYVIFPRECSGRVWTGSPLGDTVPEEIPSHDNYAIPDIKGQLSFEDSCSSL